MVISKRTIEILLFPAFNSLDVAGPAQAFDLAKNYGNVAYDLKYISIDSEPVTASNGLRVIADRKARLNSRADDLLIPGGFGVNQSLRNTPIQSLIRNWPNKRPQGRIISICSGALLLANSGLLDGKQATTHWERSAEVKKSFPDVMWRLNELYVQEGNIYTSAGVTAGIDLALHIIRQDSGPQTALGVARELVVHAQRAGGQSQFSELLEAQFSTTPALQKLITQISHSPQRDWTLQLMAETVAMTPRTLWRRFTSELNISPVRFVEKHRVKHACDAINAGLPVRHTINQFGFGDYQRMQRAFKRQLGVTIGEYQKRFSIS